jgi:hypothetical protein
MENYRRPISIEMIAYASATDRHSELPGYFI